MEHVFSTSVVTFAISLTASRTPPPPIAKHTRGTRVASIFVHVLDIDFLVESVVRCSSALPLAMALRILVLGSGGREHALVWKLSQSTLVEQIFVCPGNGGTNQVPKAKNVSVGNNTFEELVAFATQEKVF